MKLRKNNKFLEKERAQENQSPEKKAQLKLMQISYDDLFVNQDRMDTSEIIFNTDHQKSTNLLKQSSHLRFNSTHTYRRNFSTQMQRNKFLSSFGQIGNQNRANAFNMLFSSRASFRFKMSKELKPIRPCSFHIVDERVQDKIKAGKIVATTPQSLKIKLLKNMRLFHQRKSCTYTKDHIINNAEENPSMSYLRSKNKVLNTTQSNQFRTNPKLLPASNQNIIFTTKKIIGAKYNLLK